MIHLCMLVYAPHRLSVALKIMRHLARHPHVASLLFVINGETVDADDLRRRLGRVPVPVTTLKHDNSGAEFGGYQRAAEHLLASGAERFYIFNDTVGAHQYVDGAYLRRLLNAFGGDRRQPLATGSLLRASDELAIGPWQTREWLRSNLFGMDRLAFEALGRQIRLPALDEHVRDTTDVAEFFGPGVGPYLRQHLTHWLFGSGPGTWYRAQPLTDRSAPLLASRGRAILQEMALSMRLQAAGVPILDVGPARQTTLAAWTKRKLFNRTGLLLL